MEDSDSGVGFELTPKAVLLGVLLAVLLSSANAYLGLYAGMTVSASIPAAVISMVVLRFFRRSNILENNLVQTAASAGEAVAAGAIFTLPALIILRTWSAMGYFELTLLVGIGGLIGVLFSVPLRRALILETDLAFPEGIATAEVLETGQKTDGTNGTGRDFIRLYRAGLLGGLAKFAQAGLNLWNGSVQGAFVLSGTFFASGISLSPALLGVGYIVGLRIAVMVGLGGLMAWGIGIPLSAGVYGLPETTTYAGAMNLWSEKIRYVGVGAMVLGGFWSLVSLVGPVTAAIRAGIDAYWAWLDNRHGELERAEQDVPVPFLLPVLLVLLPPLGWFFFAHTGGAIPTVTILFVVVTLSFVFSAVAGYMAGLVGSSNNPVSGVTIATILGMALLLVFLLGSSYSRGATIAVLSGVVVACGAAISGDTMQDLKAGHMVRATPWKQQVMEVVGVLSASIVIVPVIDLLNRRYGIGPPTAARPDSLPAPQATLMASVADGVFVGDLPWGLIVLGLVVAVGIILLDQFLRRLTTNWRAHVLAVAVGLYLPVQLTSAILLGGIVAWFARTEVPENSESRGDSGIIVASGLITGEALVGILLALPVVLTTLHPAIGVGMFRLFETPPNWGTVMGVFCVLYVCWYLYRSGGKETIK